MGSVAFPGIKSGWFLKLALRTVTGFIPEPPPSLTIGSRPIATNCLTVLLELFSKTELQPPGESPSGISVRFHVLRGGLAFSGAALSKALRTCCTRASVGFGSLSQEASRIISIQARSFWVIGRSHPRARGSAADEVLDIRFIDHRSRVSLLEPWMSAPDRNDPRLCGFPPARRLRSR